MTQSWQHEKPGGGRADVGFADSQVAGYIVKQSNGQFQLSAQAFEVAPYGIAFPKNSGHGQSDPGRRQGPDHRRDLGKILEVTINGAIS